MWLKEGKERKKARERERSSRVSAVTFRTVGASPVLVKKLRKKGEKKKKKGKRKIYKERKK